MGVTEARKRSSRGECNGQEYCQGVLHDIQDLLPEEACTHSDSLHVALPFARGTAGKAHQSVHARPNRERRFGIDD